MRPQLAPGLFFLVVLGFNISAASQQPQTQGNFPFGQPLSDTQSYETHGALLIVTVHDEKNKVLDRQSVVKLENGNTHNTQWQATTDRSEAPFANLAVGPYDIEV